MSTALIRELFTHIDRAGQPVEKQTQVGGTAEFDVLAPIPAELLRRMRKSIGVAGRCAICCRDADDMLGEDYCLGCERDMLRDALQRVLAEMPFGANWDEQGHNPEWLKNARNVLLITRGERDDQ